MFAPVGSGHLPWRRIMDALEEVSYDGWQVVESFSSRLPELSKAACVWRDLADSEEALAVESLRFLTGLAGEG